jgi:hypothetical protein
VLRPSFPGRGRIIATISLLSRVEALPLADGDAARDRGGGDVAAYARKAFDAAKPAGDVGQ